MIVRHSTESLILITQPDHAALSGRIMESWRADELPDSSTRSSVLLATAEHDNGWREFDDRPPVDPETGRPYDFVGAPAHLKQQVWPRGVARLTVKDRAAAALVAQHPLTVLDASTDRSWSAFFVRMQAERDRLLADGIYRNSLDALLRDYRFVFLGDLLSLIFCCGWTHGLFQHHGYAVSLSSAEVLTITPDPFSGASVRLVVSARRIPNRRYTSDRDLRQELERADACDVIGVARGSAPKVSPECNGSTRLG